MTTNPSVYTSQAVEPGDEPILEKLRRANWQRCGDSSEEHPEIGGRGAPPATPAYQAYFGEDIMRVVSFLDKMASQNRTLGTHASSVSHKASHGFIVISGRELERLGIAIETGKPSRER